MLYLHIGMSHGSILSVVTLNLIRWYACMSKVSATGVSICLSEHFSSSGQFEVCVCTKDFFCFPPNV